MSIAMRKHQMKENPSRVSGKSGAPGSRRRHEAIDDDPTVECTGKHCQSCTAGLIADCVALCCCPCGLINFFALAFVKVPWMVGRRCLGRVKRKRKKRLEMKRECKDFGEGDQYGGDGNLMRMGRVEEGFWDIATGFGVGWENVEMDCSSGNVSARFEAERVWLEFYQVGHLGFGRVSYTGIQ